MKACAKNLKQLSWLAIDALEPRDAEALRAHVAACPGCRRRLEEFQSVAGKLSASNAAPVELEASETFHRRLAQRIHREDSSEAWKMLPNWLRIGGLDWRVGVPVAGITALLFIEAWLTHREPPPAVVHAAAIAKADQPMAPTFGDYRMLANRSFDALDLELTREAKSSLANGPIYKMSPFAPTIPAD